MRCWEAVFATSPIAFAADEPAIDSFVAKSRKSTSGRVRRKRLARVIASVEPAGNDRRSSGIVRRAALTPVVVVNVDNLTTLDLRALAEAHAASGAAMTVATA